MEEQVSGDDPLAEPDPVMAALRDVLDGRSPGMPGSGFPLGPNFSPEALEVTSEAPTGPRGRRVLEIGVGNGAVLRHYKLQNEHTNAFHIAANEVRLSQAAYYENFVLTIGASLSRNEVNVEILGPHAECRLLGSYLLKGNQHGDHTTFIDHAAPESSSREIYKGVLDDQSRGVFQGKILVRKDSQKTNGHQLNQALLLARGAEIDSKPELEIYADDVKCSHGATAGELDETALFYLQSRGIDKQSARNLLIAAFIHSALEEISNRNVHDAMSGIISSWLAAGKIENSL